ncbi:Hypothetical predicted protein [Cloeon dipterum]|uniref:PSI domain-containing protein n=2 Tax=Cloeon dipterum TaxID=197152 RepID=A0A8S1DXI0_9INSE|nr:Hypothetical predicted protein [Cloeon dipterum]
MAHIPKLFGTVISFLVICSSCEKVSSSDNPEVEAPKILYDSDERYFYVNAVRDVNLAKSLWVNMDSEEKADFSIVFQPAYDTQRGPTHRYLKWLKLSFDFPFYGYLTKFVSIDIDGRICMKKIKYYNEECNSFVAPLGTKLSFRKNESYIKYKDTGKSFIVQWANVDLNPPFYYVKLNVTVQATLYENGTIEFVYKQILSSLFVVYGDEFKTRVTIGTRDSKGYIGNHDHPYGSIALQERMNKDHFDIKNGTVILMTPLPTCNSFTSCHLCALSRTNFQCVWCPQLNRCTNYGMDRGYQKWVSSGCINNHISSFEYAGKCLDKRHGTGAVKIIQEKHKCDDSDKSRNVPMGNTNSVLNYKFEAHRLYSLLKKIDWEHVEPFGLAKSGFYYTGEGDNVRCTFCNVEIRGWEKGDTPDGEHRRWNPNCPFLCNDRGIINIEIGYENMDVSHDSLPAKINIGVNPFVTQEKLFEKYGQNIKFVRKSNRFILTPHDLNIFEWSKPLNPNFATLKSRINSFKDFWPKSQQKTPLEMAQAGFYYTGKADKTICFHCNFGLHDWVPEDDPCIQHCRWNSNCQYLLISSAVCKNFWQFLSTQNEIAKMAAKKCTNAQEDERSLHGDTDFTHLRATPTTQHSTRCIVVVQ